MDEGYYVTREVVPTRKTRAMEYDFRTNSFEYCNKRLSTAVKAM